MVKEGNRQILNSKGNKTNIFQFLLIFSLLPPRLVIAARSEDKLAETQHLCQEHTSHVHTVVADVSREEDCKTIVKKAVEEFGVVDILILNAAYSVAGQWFTEYKKPVRNVPSSPRLHPFQVL